MAKAYLCGDLTARDLYTVFNRRYFRNRLPEIPVNWTMPYAKSDRRSRSVIGCTEMKNDKTHTPVSIHLNPKYKTCGIVWVGTLLHEMVHVEQHKLPRSQAHGRKFQKRMKQLVARGAFNGIL